MQLPIEFISRLKNEFPEHFECVINAIEAGKPVKAARINTLKVASDGFVGDGLVGCIHEQFAEWRTTSARPADGDANTNFSRVPWCENGIYLTDTEAKKAAKSPLYAAGLYYIQEPSAMAAVAALEVKQGDAVLDMCAAPGGKTTQIAAALSGSGVVVANDISATRCRALVHNIELAGITNAVIISEQPYKLRERFYGFFDKILIDAPCSGEGMFRRDARGLNYWSVHQSEALSAVQQSLLTCAADMLKPGGEIVYSTCTFSVTENEDVVKWFLGRRGDFELVKLELEGFISGKLPGTARLWPHLSRGEGFFVAKLKKSGTGDTRIDTGRASPSPTAGAPGVFASFLERNFTPRYIAGLLNPAPPRRFLRHGERLYLTPAFIPNLSGLRVVRSGFFLGEIKKERFEPSGALALSLNKHDARFVLDLPITDERIARYLRGESFAVPDGQIAAVTNAYCLICVNGFPLGFAKAANGRLKNKYPRSWVRG